jgi:hypothetical protein
MSQGLFLPGKGDHTGAAMFCVLRQIGDFISNNRSVLCVGRSAMNRADKVSVYRRAAHRSFPGHLKYVADHLCRVLPVGGGKCCYCWLIIGVEASEQHAGTHSRIRPRRSLGLEVVPTVGGDVCTYGYFGAGVVVHAICDRLC